MGKHTRDKVQETNEDVTNVHSSTSHVEINHSSHQVSSSGASMVNGQEVLNSRSLPTGQAGASLPLQDDNGGNGLQAQVDELTADLQRIQADFANFRRRSDDERGEFLSLAKQDVIMQLLPVLDNIGRALGHTPKELTENPWAKGVSQIAKQADETLKNLGVTHIQSLGQPFDPNLHEAIGYVEDEASGTRYQASVEVVVEELQPGYQLGDKVIRHAMVKVGKK